MKTGACSVTLRVLSPREFVQLSARAGLDAIEWGGDVHVPHGDLLRARQVRSMTLDAGLEVSSYGSYYKIFDEKGNRSDFAPVLDSALELGATTIRVWAGTQPSDSVSETERARMVEALRGDLEFASQRGVRLGLEFHANTLSDSNASTLALLDEVDHPQLFTYWQPTYWLADLDYRVDGLRRLSDRVVNMHVFQWLFRPGLGSWSDSTDRRPLMEGEKEWMDYLSVPLSNDVEHYALLEFVRGDDLDRFIQDALVLRTWLANRGGLKPRSIGFSDASEESALLGD